MPTSIFATLDHLCFLFQLNLWRYGDFTDDDAKEFGFAKWEWGSAGKRNQQRKHKLNIGKINKQK